MNDILNWISRSHNEAFFLGLFLLAFCGFLLAGIGKFFDFISDCICSVTGKWPAPRPIVECNGDCDCAKPCQCCTDNGCKPGCGCASHIEIEDDDV